MSTGMSILTNGAFLTITGRRPSTMKSNITLDHASNQYPSELLFSLQQGGQKTNASTSSTLEKSGPNEMDNKTTRHSNRHSNFYGGNGIRRGVFQDFVNRITTKFFECQKDLKYVEISWNISIYYVHIYTITTPYTFFTFYTFIYTPIIPSPILFF